MVMNEDITDSELIGKLTDFGVKVDRKTFSKKRDILVKHLNNLQVRQAMKDNPRPARKSVTRQAADTKPATPVQARTRSGSRDSPAHRPVTRRSPRSKPFENDEFSDSELPPPFTQKNRYKPVTPHQRLSSNGIGNESSFDMNQIDIRNRFSNVPYNSTPVDKASRDLISANRANLRKSVETSEPHSQSTFYFIGVTLAVIVLTVLYLYTQRPQGYIEEEKIYFTPYDDLNLCTGRGQTDCNLRSDVEVVTNYLSSLVSRLNSLAYLYHCQGATYESQFEPLSSVQLSSQSTKLLFKLSDKNPHWGINFVDMEKRKALTFETAIFVVATNPTLGLACRMSNFFNSAVQYFIGLTVFITVCLASYFGLKSYLQYRKEKGQQLEELVEKITEEVRLHCEAAQSDSHLPPYVPIDHVRDNLIPVMERKKSDVMKMWSDAVQFIQDHESRIAKETRLIQGEDFFVWRWISPQSPTKRRASRPGLSANRSFTTPSNKVSSDNGPAKRQWLCPQGSPNMIPGIGLAPCLKVRGLFNPVEETGVLWMGDVRKVLLSRLQGIRGVLHCDIDETSPEGCGYIKCNSCETSGLVFARLAGCYLDNRPILTKYLHYDRYHARFPEAENLKTPLDI